MKKIVFFAFTFFALHNMFAQENRNLLSKGDSFDTIKKYIIKDKSWVTFPKYSDRNGWNKLPEKIRKEYIAIGEQYLGYEWEYIPASLYLAFIKEGNRAVMQAPYARNHVAIESLVMAELMEGKGRFINDIVDGVFYYCEQTYWGMSAHLYLQRTGQGLPDKQDPTIDLGAGKMAAQLAWIHYFFEDEFDKIHPLISKRLKDEIREKILIPYYTRVDMWWMGYTRKLVNNWNPWCNYNVLNCIMLIEDDPRTLALNVHKTMRSVDQYINYYKEDGGCEEGPGYWGHAGGKLFNYLELLHKISNGKLNVYDEPVIQNMGKYIYRAYINGEYFINFADAQAKIHSLPGVIYRYGKRIDDPLMAGFGAHLAKRDGLGDSRIPGKIEMALENLFSLDEIKNAQSIEPQLGEFHLPQTQIMGARDTAGNGKGFYFAAKGGHNDESHNHNDIGSFILYYDGNPVLVDVGVGTYTAKTFSPQRYELWNMQSGYHNLPTINGYDQKEGVQFKAGEINFSSSPLEVNYTIDIAPAYPKEAKIKDWTRSYTLQRGSKFIISDQYNLEQNIGVTSLSFMTDLECINKIPGIVELRSKDRTMVLNYNSSQLKPKIETVLIGNDARLKKVWGKEVYRIVFEVLHKEPKGDIQIEVVKK